MHRTFILNMLWIMIVLLPYHNYTARAALQGDTGSSGIIDVTEPTNALRKLLPQSAKNSIDSLFNAQVMQDHIAGAVVQIARNGVILYKKAYGFARKFELVDNRMVRLNNPDPMTLNKLFDLASLTKVFATTFGIMLLVNQGKIHLDDPVHLYLKEFRGGGKDKITIRQLLNHTSGLYEWQPLFYHARNEVETYHYICELPPGI